MSKILDKYCFNVPVGQTHWKGKQYTGGQGGLCIKGCNNCFAKDSYCKGCDIINCLDKNCRGLKCEKCVVPCHRSKERINKSFEFLNGFDVDKHQTNDSRLNLNEWYIPAINSPFKKEIKSECFSIPFYAIYDFHSDKIITTDLHDFFKIKGKIIINFYFKDDKIWYLYDLMQDNKFLSLLRKFKNINMWHTVCFSVFDKSNNMDIIHNWKRQWWCGDYMRDAGFDVIQECLTTETMTHVNCNYHEAIDIITKKGIKKISQCGQLNYEPPSKNGIDFLRKLPNDCDYLVTGMNQKTFDGYKQFKSNIYLSNYALSYHGKKDIDNHLINQKEV